jgi:hypothetical protein
MNLFNDLIDLFNVAILFNAKVIKRAVIYGL